VDNPVSGPEEATAGLAKPPFTLRFAEGWNQHHDFGASGMHNNSEVVMYLHDNGRARVTDAGEHRTSELSNQWGYQEEERVWNNAWHGTWKTEADRMVFELEPTRRECVLNITDYGDQKSKKDCPELPARVSLECKVSQVDVAPNQVSREEDKQPHTVWVCFPEGGVKAMGGSSPSWVFAESVCLQISSGFRGKGRSFSVCEEDRDQNGAKPPADQ